MDPSGAAFAQSSSDMAPSMAAISAGNMESISNSHLLVDGAELGSVLLDGAEGPRKLAILGLPWDTT